VRVVGSSESPCGRPKRFGARDVEIKLPTAPRPTNRIAKQPRPQSLPHPGQGSNAPGRRVLAQAGQTA